MKEMKRQALMIYLFVAYKTRAKYLSWDSIGGISTRNKHGALAQAITYLPKRKELYNIFLERLDDLTIQGYTPNLNSPELISPYLSQICGSCFKKTGKMRKNLMKGIYYDEFRCYECGKKSKRHSNSAQVAAILLKNKIIEKICNN